MMRRGARLTVDVEKAAAGGRMLARHAGQVVLVSGAIPGERIVATVERVAKGVMFADTTEVLSASPDRRQGTSDPRCGGALFSHIVYRRQCQLKGEIIRDAFTRIGRLPLPAAPEVIGSPETGYRMRARLHVQGARIGFFREGTHELCDPRTTGQLLPATLDWIDATSTRLARLEESSPSGRGTLTGGGVTAIEIAENVRGDQRAVHLELQPEVGLGRYADMVTATDVADDIDVGRGATLTLRRHVRSFFQGNRFLLERLVQHVASLIEDGPVVDLYAGVGLFGLSLAARGSADVTMVEGDRFSGADLVRNAEPFGSRVVVRQQSVESFLAGNGGPSRRAHAPDTVIVDPPRTGMTRDALGGIIARRPARIVYVSCDVATLARDARTLVDAGYDLDSLTGMDLFPTTAHVESIALFARGGTDNQPHRT